MHTHYYNYWNKIFNITVDELKNNQPLITSQGRLIEKYGDQYIYFYQDLTNHKKIICGSQRNLSKLHVDKKTLSTLDFNTISSHNIFENLKLTFHDIDYTIPRSNFTAPVTSINSYNIRQLTIMDNELVQDFHTDCSDDDKDTLDLDLENDMTFGTFYNGHLAVISRFIKIRDTDVADITILTRQLFRGQKLSTPLAAEIVNTILSQGLYPKYRVQVTNIASIKIAEKLGLIPSFRLLTWEISDSNIS